MYHIVDLIEFHNESEYLDFKLEEYTSAKSHILIKDVLCFANGAYHGDRYIIIGVKKKDGKVTLNNIESQTDSASVQQLIINNIYPELRIEYVPFEYKGINLMILVIKNPQERPYLTKKQVSYPTGNIFLRENELWIRKGDHQMPANRNDLENIYGRRAKDASFEGKVEVAFSETGTGFIEIEPVSSCVSPSEKAKKRINDRIKHLIGLRETDLDMYVKQSNLNLPGSFRTYETSNIGQLESDLESLTSKYKKKDDLYYFEELPYKMNFSVLNNADSYIEDASIFFTFPKIMGMEVVKDLVRPDRNMLQGPDPELLFYPTVSAVENGLVIAQDMGDIKHKIKEAIFKVDLRVLFLSSINISEIPIICELHGKNIKTPLKFTLLIRIKKVDN